LDPIERAAMMKRIQQAWVLVFAKQAQAELILKNPTSAAKKIVNCSKKTSSKAYVIALEPLPKLSIIKRILDKEEFIAKHEWYQLFWPEYLEKQGCLLI
jgi:hypothetical protein